MQRVNPIWKDADSVKSLWILNPKSKVNPMPRKFAVFCSVTIYATYPDTFPHLIIRVCSKTKMEPSLSWISSALATTTARATKTSLAIKWMRASFNNFFAFISVNSLKMANKGELPYRVLGTAPNFGLREETEFVPVLTSSKQRRKRKFTVAGRAKIVVFHLLIGLIAVVVTSAFVVAPRIYG